MFTSSSLTRSSDWLLVNVLHLLKLIVNETSTSLPTTEDTGSTTATVPLASIFDIDFSGGTIATIAAHQQTILVCQIIDSSDLTKLTSILRLIRDLVCAVRALYLF